MHINFKSSYIYAPEFYSLTKLNLNPMLRNIYLACSFILISFLTANAQNTGSIKGRVLDKASGEPLPFANVVAETNGRQAGGAQTDFDGNYTIKPLSPGTYEVKVTFVGYSASQVNGVLVSADKITFQDLKLTKGAVDINTVVIEDYAVPLIDKGQTSTQQTITAEQIDVAPTRDVKSIAATSAGIVQKDEGDNLNVRGSRDNATDYIVDGVRIRGNIRLPQSSVDQITIKTGGLEAQYGDNTGGVIVVTTKGPAEEFAVGVEAVTSELFDDYGYNLYGLNLSGPIYSKKTETGKRTIAGFSISGEYQKEKDPDPSAVGMYKLKDGVLDELKSNPLQVSLATGTVLEPRSLYINKDDVEKINFKQNLENKAYRFSGKIDISPVKNVNITLGGNYDHNDGHIFSLNNALYNYDHNENRIETNINGFLRFTQKFAGSSESSGTGTSSTIKNAYYTIQFDYSKFDQVRQDDHHEDRFFDYGYIGKFTQYEGTSFANATVENTDTPVLGDSVHVVQTGLPDVLYTFEPGNINVDAQAYTLQYYDFANNSVSNFTQVLQNNALINGSTSQSVHAIWSPFGQVFNLYQTLQQEQYTAKLTFSADIKNHNFMFGFEYEQRIERSFGINPRTLWTLMRLRANLGRDEDGDLNFVNDTAFWVPTYTSADALGRPTFYENVRARLGLGTLDFVDIDSYDRSNFSLDLFNADELLNGGNQFVAYHGYDHTGKKLSGTPSYRDFFKAVDANGNYTRAIDAFRPVYMAGYIQDKFAINDLIFNVGVRIDRFDANQKILADPYTLYPARTVGELAEVLAIKPSTIGNDFIPYVKDPANPSASDIIGYRDGDTWYNSAGEVVQDPSIIAQINSSVPFPWLADTRLAGARAVESDEFEPDQSFKDYEPQTTVMPRVAFSFPISDEAQFFAHYDVLTQRPPARLRSDPTDYFYWDLVQGAIFANPNLKPERTTDYELGFKQTLSKSSAMSISAFYRELRNLIQQITLPFAYPKQYFTYGNIDFGTVKGLIFSYDLRRTGNVRMNANYTLQFAEGTGSNDAVANKLLNNGLPNLRTLTPLDFDQRHVFSVVMDYRYGSGKDYNGPMLFNKQIFSNTGVNIEFKVNSGTPYSAQRDITTQAGNIGLQQISSGVLAGSVNGSRLPWQNRVNLRVDKTFALKVGKESSRAINFNIYFLVQNLLNTKNVINVYQATGVPDDDGYIASAAGQNTINGLPLEQQQPYVDNYAIKVVNPDNYSLPRRMRLGLQIDF